MKRIQSACVEETLCFENSVYCENYLRTLNRKHVKYRILERKQEEDGYVVLCIKRDYNGYPVGDYLEEEKV